MKRQSVEDYAKERCEMKSPVDEYILVTNKELGRKNNIDLNIYYKVVEKYDSGKVSIYNPKTGILVFLSRNDFVYAYICITNEFVAKRNGLKTDRFYEVTDIIRNYEGEEIGVAIIKDDLSRCCQTILYRGEYKRVKSVDKEIKTKQEPKNKPDSVNHPSHYETGKFECIEVMEEALGRDVVKGFCIGNAFKYLYRAKRKNGLEDLKKAQWYLNRVISMEDADNTKDPYAEQKARLKKIEEKILNEANKSKWSV